MMLVIYDVFFLYTVLHDVGHFENARKKDLDFFFKASLWILVDV